MIAHVLSEGNAWIAPLTVAGIALVVLFVLVVADRVVLDEPGDLLLPLATVVLVAGLSGPLATQDWLLDQGPWLVPASLVLLAGMVATAVTDSVALARRSRATLAVVGVAVAAGALAFAPLDDAWFGEEPAVFAVERDGDASAELTLVEPPDDEGRFVVEVALDGGTIGDNVPAATTPQDTTRDMFVRFYVGTSSQFPAVPEECASAEECRTARFELFDPTPDDPLGSVTVEFLTADQLPFAEPLTASLDEDAVTG